MNELKLISTDSHVNEPGDLWVERIGKRFRDRALSLARTSDDSIDERRMPREYAMNARGGVDSGSEAEQPPFGAQPDPPRKEVEPQGDGEQPDGGTGRIVASR